MSPPVREHRHEHLGVRLRQAERIGSDAGLERRLLRYGEFTSVDDLADRIIAFINDYNRRAKPFRWTYDGRPLKVV